MQPSVRVTVDYQYLTADEAEALRTEVAESNEIQREVWGNLGRDGDQKLKEKTLAECDTEHLKNILMIMPQLGNRRRAMIIAELDRRADEQADALYRERTIRRWAYGVIICVVISWLVGCGPCGPCGGDSSVDPPANDTGLVSP